MKAKHQRLVLIVLALVALVGAGLLAAYALRNQASYFYLPEQMLADPPQVGQAVRLGGMVEEGSLATAPDGITLTFAVTGNDGARVPGLAGGARAARATVPSPSRLCCDRVVNICCALLG